MSLEELFRKNGRVLCPPVIVVSPEPEKACARPRFRPGDAVLTRRGEYGMIWEAYAVIEGAHLRWCRELPTSYQGGEQPFYMVMSIPGLAYPSKAAWRADEFYEVALGLLHDLEEMNTESPAC